jgi:D-alanine-D-alanine ligase
MSKLRVAVLRGGPSNEYDVSLKTGASVLRHMPEKYQTHDILIDKAGTWHRDGSPRSPDRALTNVDIVFNALRGEYGEDGKVQRTLDTIGIPYTGSGSLASAIGMNKVLAKQAFAESKIKTPYYTTVKKDDDLAVVHNHIFHHFYLPIMVKPATSGSSVGVSIVKDFRFLIEAIEKALAVSDTALVEEFMRGREASCGVVDGFRNQSTYTLMPVEIIHSKEHEFFDREAKNAGLAREVYPGNFSDAEKQEIQRLARLAHESLGLRHYSRSDFIVTPRRGVYILEVNTLPALSAESLMVKSLDAVGCSLPDFLDHVLTIAHEGR